MHNGNIFTIIKLVPRTHFVIIAMALYFDDDLGPCLRSFERGRKIWNEKFVLEGLNFFLSGW